MGHSIFVQIAAFRDAQTQWTVLDALRQADRPHAIRFGICWQGMPGEQCFSESQQPPGRQVRVLSVDARQTYGANWARSVAGQLYQGESHVLLIDSHMRFEPGWDSTLLAMLAACPAPKSLLSTFLPSYAPPRVLEPPLRLVPQVKVNVVSKRVVDPQIVHLTWRHWAPDALPAQPRPTPFVVQNFMFMPAATLEEVPIDPHFFFYGDELSMSVRLFTAGWNVYQPTRKVLYHQWRHRDAVVPRERYRDMKLARQTCAAHRLLHLLGLRRCEDPSITRELDVFDLGQQRNVAQFNAWAGVDLAGRRASDPALQGEWTEPPAAEHATSV